MQNWVMIMQNAPTRVGVLLFNAFSTHCLANAVEPLRAANTLARRDVYRWSYLGLDGAPVVSSSGLPVTPEGRLADHPAGDMLLIIPSYDFEDHATPECQRALRSAAKRFTRLVGFDTGSWLMAAAGLLDGQRATIHWDELDRFAETFPEVSVTDDRYVAEGRMLSCGGGVTALELMLALIRQVHGPMLALEVGALFMHGERPLDDPLPPAPGGEVAAAVAVMRRHLEAPLPVAAIAQRIGMTQRRLEALFRRETGQSPRDVYIALRLNAARRLVEQTRLSVSEVAMRVGYEDASAFTRAFRWAFDATPQAMRLNVRTGGVSGPTGTS